MNVIVRFYWQHDLDLIALSKHPDFDIGRSIKKAIIAFAKGEPLTIHVPDPSDEVYYLDNTSTHFVLNDIKDTEAVDLINSMRTGFKNNAIKTIFRRYLDRPFLPVFFDGYHFKSKTKRSDAKKESNAEMKVSGKIITETAEETVNTEQEISAAVRNFVQSEPATVPESDTEEKVIREKPESHVPDKTKTDPGDDKDSEEEPFDVFSAVKGLW